MSINKKVFLLFSSLFIALSFLLFNILKDRENRVLNFEDRLVEKKITNLNNIIKNKIKKLNTISYEYSINEKIINTFKSKKSKFNALSSKLNVSYFILLDNNKEIIYSEVFDISSDEYLDLPQDIEDFFTNTNIDEYIKNKEDLKFVSIDYEKLIFSIERVDDFGYIFVARTIDSSFLSEISMLLDSYLFFVPSYTFNKNNVNEGSFYYDINRENEKELYVNIQIKDEFSTKPFFFSIKIARDFYNEISSSNNLLVILFALSFLLLNLIVYIFINILFTKRIGQISKTVKNISKNKDLVENIELIYDDEITYLSQKMNEMFKVINNKQNENIKKERDFLQSVLDSQQHIIFITDGNEIQSANKKFLDLFKSSNSFFNNIALLDDKTHSSLLKIAKTHSSIDKPAKLKINEDEDKYFVFDISRVEVEKYIICMNDVSKYNERICHLQNKATIDELTSCFNKNTINEYAKYWLEIQDFGLIILDIDKFKTINDTYGHYIGDCILSDLSKLIKMHLHDDDLLGRFGGEEFIVLINDSSNNIENIANRLRQLIQDFIFIYEDLKLSITVSIGCTYCKRYEEFDVLFKKADESLYEAKNSGRNKVVYT